MKLHFQTLASILTLTTLLSACGGDNVQIDTPRTAAMTQADLPSSAQARAPAAAPATLATPAAAPGATQVASADMPQPDCVADGCKGLRIIDANAEAFRYQAMQHGGTSQL